MSAPAFIRPVRDADFGAIFALAQQAGRGMTNLPPEEKALRARIDHALESFASNPTSPSGEVYMLVLEQEGASIGTCAVFSAIGLEHGFVNYRIIKTIHASTQLKKRIERRVLMPTHDFTGCGEVGSLFLSADARGGGFGKFLARARYLFIANHKDLVADPVCAELRGWQGPNGEQPFWEALGKPFFDMEFEDADLANASMGNQMIADMMPRHPIYVALLPESAKAILGQPHPSGEPAFNMLLKEGFAYRGYIDVFDGGPLVAADIEEIKTVRESVVAVAQIGEPPADAPTLLMAAGRLDAFRCARAPAILESGRITLGAQAGANLGVSDGDEVRAVRW